MQTGQQIGQPLQGHTDKVYAVAISPDGTKAVSGSSDNTIRIWDMQTGQQIGQPLQTKARVYAIAISPDGKQIVYGLNDKTIRIWDMQTGQQIDIPFWDIRTMKQTLQPLHHFDIITSLAISPDGTKIVSGSDSEIRTWDMNTHKQIGQPLQTKGKVYAIAISPDGKQIVYGLNDKTIRIWDMQTGQQIDIPFWDIRTMKQTLQPLHHFDIITSLAISPDGKQIVSSAQDEDVYLWNIIPTIEGVLQHSAQKNSESEKGKEAE